MDLGEDIVARIRYLKPGFFDDTELAELSRDARMLYAGLWCYSDRDGISEDDPKLIKRNIFPYDDDLTIKAITALLDEIVLGGFLRRFTYDGKKYFYCPTLSKHQNFHKDEKARFHIPIDVVRACMQHGASAAVASCQPPASTTGNGELVTGNWNGDGELQKRADTVQVSVREIPRDSTPSSSPPKTEMGIIYPGQIITINPNPDPFVGNEVLTEFFSDLPPTTYPTWVKIYKDEKWLRQELELCSGKWELVGPSDPRTPKVVYAANWLQNAFKAHPPKPHAEPKAVIPKAIPTGAISAGESERTRKQLEEIANTPPPANPEAVRNLIHSITKGL
jgi:hypothetical protein